MKKLILLFIAFFAMSTMTSDATVSQMSDLECFELYEYPTYDPVVNATLFNTNSGQGTVTDFDGCAKLECEPNDIVIVSYLGFKTYRAHFYPGTCHVIVLMPEDYLFYD